MVQQSTTNLEQKAMIDAAQVAAARLGVDRRLSQLRIGRTGVFRLGDTILKVCPASWRTYESIEREIAVIHWVYKQGICVPEPKSGVIEVGKHFVFASEFIAAEKEFSDWEEVGNTVRALHRLRPVNMELPDCQASIAAPLSGRITDLLQREQIDQSEAQFLRERFALGVETYNRDYASDVLCHGDLHSGNIIFTSNGPCFLDWEKAGLGLPAIDLSKIIGQQARGRLPQREFDAFLLGYGPQHPLDDPNIKSMRLISEVSGITYLIGSSSAEQSYEGRRRLEGLMSGKAISWRNC